MRTLVFLVAIGLGAFASAAAPTGPQTTTVYYAPELVSTAGIVEVSPHFTTVLRFPGRIEDYYLGEETLLKIKVQDNVFVIWPLQRAGRTDLHVLVNGQSLEFIVEVVPEGQPREYIIKEHLPYRRRATSPLQPAARNTWSTPSPPPATTAPAQPSPESTTNDALPPRKVAEASKGGQVAFAGARVEGNARLIAPGQIAAFLSVTNTGVANLVLDPESLEVRQNGKLLEHFLIRTPPEDVVPPTRALTMTVQVMDAQAGAVDVVFNVRDEGSGVTYSVVLEFWPTDKLGPARKITVSAL